MAGTLHLEVVTPQEQKYSGEATYVQLPGSEGEMGVLAMHCPLVAMLAAGELIYRNASGQFSLAVADGFMTVAENKLICLVDRALTPEQIKADAVAKRRGEVEAQLQQEPQNARLRSELAWIAAQERVAKLSR